MTPPVLCCVCVSVLISAWYAPRCLCFQSSILPCCMQQWCRTVFICVHPSSHDALWLPTPALPPISFPFIGSVPLSLPSPCCCILLIFPSLCGQGATESVQTGQRGRNVKLFFALILFVCFLQLLACAESLVQHRGCLRYNMAEHGFKLRGRNFLTGVTRGLVAAGCATGDAVMWVTQQSKGVSSFARARCPDEVEASWRY